MTRMTEDGMPASVGQKTKQRTVQCPHCSIELNLPESALGRRLKCPKCDSKFTAPAMDSPSNFEEGSSLFLPIREGTSSGSLELPSFGGSSGDVELPSSSASLRETYDLPLLSDPAPAARPKPAAKPGAPATGDVGDALALFKDEPKSNRKLKGAEARAQARRCSSCSSIVPAGMSLCSTCGLDLDTGQRIEPLDVYDDEGPVSYRAPAPPMGIMVIGSLFALGFLVLSMISLFQWRGGTQGAQFLLVIWMFGLYGAVQFLRRKSIRPLFIALSLTVGVGSVYLIALPIYYANMPPEVVMTDLPPMSNPVENQGEPQIRPITENLNVDRIMWGVGSLLAYAAMAVYLNSSGLRRQFKR